MLILILALLVLFQIKHFLADYPFQNEYMLRKFLPSNDFIVPLLAHCGVHGLFTFFIALPFGLFLALKMTILDIVIHFIMDRIKASPKMLGRFKTLTASEFPTATGKQKLDNKLFWWSLGFDQMVHHLTHYVIIYFIVRSL